MEISVNSFVLKDQTGYHAGPRGAGDEIDKRGRWRNFYMASQIMLAPNPTRSGAIDRVLIIANGSSPEKAVVLNVDELSKNSKLLTQFNPGYHYATKFWDAVSALILVGGIVLSFVWHWWAWIAGFVIAFVIYRSNRKSVADFAKEILDNDPNAIVHFASLGLIWEINRAALVPER